MPWLVVLYYVLPNIRVLLLQYCSRSTTSLLLLLRVLTVYMYEYYLYTNSICIRVVTASEVNRMTLLDSKACQNRYWDKTMQVVVFGNGKASFIGEHSRCDGMPTTHLLDATRRAGVCGDFFAGPEGYEGAEAAALSGRRLADALMDALSSASTGSLPVRECLSFLLPGEVRQSFHCLHRSCHFRPPALQRPLSTSAGVIVSATFA